MDTMNQPVISPAEKKHYRRHSREFKLALVKQTLHPGASVARIARENGINANQVFAWRKLYREGVLGSVSDTAPALLPVQVIESAPVPSEAPCSSHATTMPAGVIRFECAKGHLIIEGAPDSGILDRVLERLLR